MSDANHSADDFEAKLWKDPSKFGFCNFETFRKNPDKWRPNPEDAFASVAQAGTLYKGKLRKIKYTVEGARVDSIEKAQWLSRQMGYRDKDMTYRVIEIIEVAGGKMDLVIGFFHKDTIEKRNGWAHGQSKGISTEG